LGQQERQTVSTVLAIALTLALAIFLDGDEIATRRPIALPVTAHRSGGAA